MTKRLTTKRQSETAIRLALYELDRVVELSRKRIEKATPETRDLVIVKARQALSDLISDELVQRVFCPLICTSDGPSCDKDPLTHADPYPLKVYRRCWVEALINGWKLSQLHIHKGQACKKWPPLQPGRRRTVSERPTDEDWSDDAERAHAAAEASQV